MERKSQGFCVWRHSSGKIVQTLNPKMHLKTMHRYKNIKYDFSGEQEKKDLLILSKRLSFFPAVGNYIYLFVH